MNPKRPASRLLPELLVAGLTLGASLAPTATARSFHHEGVLGTSMQLLVCGADDAAAGACERVVLAEVDRLDAILSTYRADSEVSRVMAGHTDARSAELTDVLSLYAIWSGRTNGAIDVNLRAVRDLWRTGDARPSDEALARAYAERRAWNLDALGKAYVIERCVAVARTIVPSGLLNIGGDLRAWGEVAFPVAIADERAFADNGPGVGVVRLREAAIASSGSYLRCRHLIDPRTLCPIADTTAAATVLAADCVTANALATALCVTADPAPALRFASGYRMTRAAVTTTGGVLGHALNAGTTTLPAAGAEASTSAADPWPSGFRVTVNLALKKADEGGRAKRPYVAVWVEDEKGVVVRHLALWGDERKYIPEMTGWWRAAREDMDLAVSLASATRPAGKYVLAWDGKDQTGKPVPQGKYRVRFEINREHGRHVRPSLAITCGANPVSVTLKATAETDESVIEYGVASPGGPAK